jgi:hypothetical protein
VIERRTLGRDCGVRLGHRDQDGFGGREAREEKGRIEVLEA